jgi:hypothetical protein
MICDKYRGKNTGPQCVKMAVPKRIAFLFQDCIVAFNFAHEDDARNMDTVLNQKLAAKKQRKMGELELCYHGSLGHLQF